MTHTKILAAFPGVPLSTFIQPVQVDVNNMSAFNCTPQFCIICTSDCAAVCLLQTLFFTVFDDGQNMYLSPGNRDKFQHEKQRHMGKFSKLQFSVHSAMYINVRLLKA